MPLPNRMNPLGRRKPEQVFTITVKPGILDSSLTYQFVPRWNTGGYCRILDWGDGTSEDAVSSATPVPHTYAAAGTYTIKIAADCHRIKFGETVPYAWMIYDSNGNWDALGNLTIGQNMFKNCSNAIFNFRTLPEGITTAQSMFKGCSNAVLPLTALPDALTAVDSMFQDCSSALLPLTSLPSGLTNGSAMFADCINAEMALTALPSAMTACSGMFGCTSASEIKLDLDTVAANAPAGGWPDVVSIANMFTNCPEVTGSQSAFLAEFPNVTDTANAFTGTNTTP